MGDTAEGSFCGIESHLVTGNAAESTSWHAVQTSQSFAGGRKVS